MSERTVSYPLRVTSEDFCRIFGTDWGQVPERARAILAECNFRYRRPTPTERDDILLSIIKRIDSADFWVSGESKQDIWERGWSENLLEFEKTGNLARLWPKFLAGKKILRMEDDWILPECESFEFDLVDVHRRWVFSKYLTGCTEIFEFGCGSCQHLPVLVEMFPDVVVHGLDWASASSKIIRTLSTRFGWNVRPHLFNLFEPDDRIPLGSDAGVVTIGTMEQLGSNFDNFLQFLYRKKPRVVVHLETLDELYDPAKLSGYLAMRYDRARNYLSNYLSTLRQVENDRTVEIVASRHVAFGSMYHDSYSLLVWRPL